MLSYSKYSLLFLLVEPATSWVQHETPEEGWMTYQPKHCEHNNQDEINSPNILSNNNYQATSQKFKQILCVGLLVFTVCQLLLGYLIPKSGFW